jgi:hypothetical protein
MVSGILKVTRIKNENEGHEETPRKKTAFNGK